MSMDMPEDMEVFKYDGNGMPGFRKIRKPKTKPKLPPHPLSSHRPKGSS